MQLPPCKVAGSQNGGAPCRVIFCIRLVYTFAFQSEETAQQQARAAGVPVAVKAAAAKVRAAAVQLGGRGRGALRRVRGACMQWWEVAALLPELVHAGLAPGAGRCALRPGCQLWPKQVRLPGFSTALQTAPVSRPVVAAKDSCSEDEESDEDAAGKPRRRRTRRD